jgi:hypothetical protein
MLDGRVLLDCLFVLVSDIILTEVNREIILKTYYVTI